VPSPAAEFRLAAISASKERRIPFQVRVNRYQIENIVNATATSSAPMFQNKIFDPAHSATLRSVARRRQLGKEAKDLTTARLQ